MQIYEIVFENFRQFYGPQTLKISTDPKKNVTLIHAENGVGKTTILNSILWAMFGPKFVTSKFEQKDQIINFEAADEGKNVALVTVKFEQDEQIYHIRRVFELVNGKPETTLTARRNEKGNYSPIRTPETLIETIIPSDSAKYFFFDGEHAETFSSEHNSRQVDGAIRAILGCGIVEMGIEDLKFIARKFQKQIGERGSSVEAKALERNRQTAETKILQFETLLKAQKEEIEKKKEEIEKIDDFLRSKESSKQLQLRRDELGREAEKARGNLKKAKGDYFNWLQEFGVSVVGQTLTSKAEKFINAKSLRGVIPSPYNEEFVKDLLEDEVCICGRPIKKGTKEFGMVMKLVEKASNATLRSRVKRAESAITRINEQISHAFKDLNRRLERIDKWENELQRLEEDLGTVSKELEKIGEVDTTEKEKLRREIDKEKDKLIGERARTEADMGREKENLAQIEKQQDLILVEDQVVKRHKDRKELCLAAVTRMEEELEDYQKDARKIILKKVNDILKKFLKKDFKASWGSGFSLQLRTSQGKLVPKSGGENQLLSLAFISALVNFSKIRKGASGKVFIPGTIAPLVLDAPFGQLDPVYKKATAEFIPDLADQVVLLVTRSQGDSKVIECIKDRIGAEYILISENRGPRGQKGEDKVKLYGKGYAGSLYGCKRNLTRVERVR